MKPGSGHVALNTGHATEFCVTSTNQDLDV